MTTAVERAAPQLWFRPSQSVPLHELLRLIDYGVISRTPRLGARDEHHPKGYCVGERTNLEVHGPKPTQADGEDPPHLQFKVEITGLLIIRLDHLVLDDLEPCGPQFRSWSDVQQALSGFEGRCIEPSEIVTIVRFNRLERPNRGADDLWANQLPLS